MLELSHMSKPEFALESAPGLSTIHVTARVNVASSNWETAISAQLEVNRPSKRRKLNEPSSSSPDEEQPERILLLYREITLRIEHEESYGLLFDCLKDEQQSPTTLAVDWGIRNAEKATRTLRRVFSAANQMPVGMASIIRYKHLPDVEQSMRLYPKNENSELFSFSFHPTELSTEAWLDIKWATIVASNNKHKTAPLKEFKLESSLVLVHDANGLWSCSLVIKITIDAANEWTNRSLELSRKGYWDLLARGLPVGQPDVRSGPRSCVAPKDFYLSAHVPEKNEHIPWCVQSTELTCDLLPFQRRAISWMLKREGVKIAPAEPEKLALFKDRLGTNIPPTFFKQLDKNGDTCYVSHILGIASKDLDILRELTVKYDINGGILAEEMGLGKTVELVALLCLHRRKCVSGETVHDSCVDRKVKASAATLIITPPSILRQWQNEIARHAPDLKVSIYEGIKKSKDPESQLEEFLGYDVVLTTYSVLAAEVHFAQSPPERNMRYQKVYQVPRSPLVEIQWWRVCLDEAQMIESGVSNAAIVAREIPRVNAWCVTGTPVRKDVDDLYGLLLFLRYEPFCNKDLWHRLVRYNCDAFKSLFQYLSLRHSKDFIRDEMTLPPQNRVVVTVPFSQVEEENYRQQFLQMCSDCNVDSTGTPLTDDWEAGDYTETMRTWLMRLRQTCLHPEAGERNKKAFGQRNGPLRTVEEVLAAMIEQHMVQMRTDERALYQAIIKRGQVYEAQGKVESAMDAWNEALQLVQVSVAECRKAVQEELERCQEDPKRDLKGKSKVSDDVETQDEGDGQRQPGKKSQTQQRVGIARNRLKSFLELEHACYFWLATAYFQLKEKEEKKASKTTEASDGGSETPGRKLIEEYGAKETAYYDQAKKLRLELMQESRKKALAYITEFENKKERQAFVEVPDIIPPDERTGGIESQPILNSITELVNALNEQVILFDEFRENLVALLLEPLVDQDDGKELGGNEVEVSVEKQEESYAYMSALRALLADREQALMDTVNLLIQQDTRTALERPSKVHSDVFSRLIAEKDKANPIAIGHESLRSLLNRLKSLISNLKQQEDSGSQRAGLERQIAEKEFKKLQTHQVAQVKAVQDSFKEVELFRNATNSRLDFYRQLQAISDTLLPIDIQKEYGFKSITDPLFRMITNQEAALRKKINTAKSRGRYLLHLSGKKVGERPTCLICLDVYEMGIISNCGHSFCKDCIMIWRKQARTCPACKASLKPADFFQITYNPKAISMQKESQDSSPETTSPNSPASKKIYADVDDWVLNEIKAIELPGASYGSKIDMITRHLVWLKRNEPGFKAVLFSQWGDVLEVIKESLDRAKIGHASLKQAGIDKFRNDPEIHCFLLHARSQSAGLTLVNATHVFLCEPLLNVGLELQAISRVHRIGQNKTTTVWLYAVNNTVEQSVMELAAGRRMALIGRDSNDDIAMTDADSDLNGKLEAAESEELRQGVSRFIAKAAKGGEMVLDGDLWGCLFSRAKEQDAEAAKNELTKKELMASAAEGRRNLYQ
ncbi:SNF2 family N-terminal domain-containing protein [Sphaerosporella brunnea]|uniref:SNF2 family N-terminal domain-containing protein n=1 Tax=Sphaerosporella brunnea TaxID=1250544 RepID=A0A5J5EW01_9PEZI|nr:SNF2 family N-terminal domain-containing protein [Sphaerosporella brunnea]